MVVNNVQNLSVYSLRNAHIILILVRWCLDLHLLRSPWEYLDRSARLVKLLLILVCQNFNLTVFDTGPVQFSPQVIIVFPTVLRNRDCNFGKSVFVVVTFIHRNVVVESSLAHHRRLVLVFILLLLVQVRSLPLSARVQCRKLWHNFFLRLINILFLKLWENCPVFVFL